MATLLMGAVLFFDKRSSRTFAVRKLQEVAQLGQEADVWKYTLSAPPNSVASSEMLNAAMKETLDAGADSTQGKPDEQAAELGVAPAAPPKAPPKGFGIDEVPPAKPDKPDSADQEDA